ncbi:MAG: DNA helicase RecQ [bacterium]
MLSLKNPQEILYKVFGYKTFRGKQQEIIEHILNGNDGLVLMPTGGGKSLCFQIPALCFEGITVVISPLIALMQDQVNALKQAGVRASVLNSTLNAEKSNLVEEQIFNNELDLVYVSPERLNTEGFLNLLKKSKISLFAIDEAHCVSQWGHDFRPEYTKFSALKEIFPNVPRIALTATADELTRIDIIKNLNLENGKVFVSSFDRPNIEYTIKIKDNEKKQLLNFIKEDHRNDSGIVYCISRKRVEEVAAYLKKEGFNALPYHAGLDKKIREKNQEKFIKEESMIMVATIAFGMGIDKPDVRFVAHLDLPKSVESYYQETGRAGRDGLPADAWMVYGLKDIVQLKQFIESSTSSPEQKRIEHQKLNTLIGYVETVNCRRRILLDYFAEELKNDCKNCDNCLEPPVTYDATVDVQKVLSCIYRTQTDRYGFGGGHIINILLGKDDEKVKKFKHDKLSTFGIGKDVSESQWKSIIRQVAILGFVEMDMQYSTLKTNLEANDVLRGKQKVELRKFILESKVKLKKPAPAKKAVLTADADVELFNELKKIRLSFARDENMPPYIIFNDKTLIEMVNNKPETLDDMSEISGVGEHKLKKYGLAFLNAING